MSCQFERNRYSLRSYRASPRRKYRRLFCNRGRWVVKVNRKGRSGTPCFSVINELTQKSVVLSKQKVEGKDLGWDRTKVL